MSFKKIIFSFFSFSFLFAECVDEKEGEKNTGFSTKIIQGYNAPARVDVNDSWDIFLSSSYLYWQVKEGGMEVAKSFSSSEKLSIKNMNNNFQSGYKVAASSKFCYDDWSVFLEYTRLHEHRNTQVSAEDGGYLEPFNLYYSALDEDSEKINHATSCLKKLFFSYDMLDIDFNRSCYKGSKLTFLSFFGARGGWIDQKVQVSGDLINTETYAVKQGKSLTRSSSWLIGPRIGLDTNWEMGSGFRFFSNGGFSLLYQHFNISFKQSNYLNLSKISIFAKDKIGYLNPNLDFILGLGFRRFFDEKRWNVDLSIGYSFLYFWNQNFLRSFSDKILYKIDSADSSLMIHGLTATLRLDF
jgi:hypothetical protein